MTPPTERPGFTLLVVTSGTLLSTLAASTINLALPVLGRDLHLDLQLSRWVMLAYFLTSTVSLPLAGRLGDLFSHRTIYQVGFGIFGVMSLLCGLAWSFGPLVAARALQALAASMIMATGPALLTTSFPSTQRGRALGFLSTATYVGLTLGPSVGGWILAELSWRWIFLINVPIAALVVLLSLFFLPVRAARRAMQPFDRWGAITLFLSLPALALAAAQGASWGWLSRESLLTTSVGMIALWLFITIELRRPAPLMNLHLFRSRTFSGAAFSALCNYVALFVPLILLPYYMFEALNFPPHTAGLVLSAQPLIMALVASPAGWLSDRIGTRGLSASGMIILSVGLAGMTTLGSSSSTLILALWLAITGLGTGIFISPNSSALMGSAPREQQGVAGAVMAVARTLGMLLGISGGTSLFQTMGGKTGQPWTATNYEAQRVALGAAALVSLLGGLASLLRGSSGSDME
jgi:EmrB/QacA subfamily drug resistance transporter